MITPSAVDLTELKAMLATIQSHVDGIDGQHTPRRGDNNKEISAQKAVITRELLFIAHLCDRARMATLDEYQVIKGFSDHLEMEQ